MAICADLLDGAIEKADAVLHAADRRTAPRARGEDFMAACLCLFDGLGNADTEKSSGGDDRVQ